MSNPDQQSMAKLKRLVRYLERERQCRRVPLCGKMAIEMNTFTDSDWAGCKETRKPIMRRSAEAELCAAALGASELKVVLSLLKDCGFELKPVLAIVAEATEHILHRQGSGKLKPIDVAYLSLQD